VCGGGGLATNIGCCTTWGIGSNKLILCYYRMQERVLLATMLREKLASIEWEEVVAGTSHAVCTFGMIRGKKRNFKSS